MLCLALSYYLIIENYTNLRKPLNMVLKFMSLYLAFPKKEISTLLKWS